MLWIAGLIGVAAAGSAMFLGETSSSENDDTDNHTPPEDDIRLTDNLMMALPLPEALPAQDDAPSMTVVNEVDPGAEWTDPLVISGSSEPDTLIGAGGNDQLNGYEGDDTVSGGLGNDTLHGSYGLDSLIGGGGNDLLHGEDGQDILFGDEGDDRLYGHGGDDRMAGDAGRDTLHGGQGDDRLSGGTDNDALHGNHGNDQLQGGAGEDTLFGGFGNDLIFGISDSSAETDLPLPDGKDYLNGGDGNDTVIGGASDVITAGAGADDIVLGDWMAEHEAAEIMDFEPGEDRLLVVWDLDADPEPDVNLTSDPDAPGMIKVTIGGEEVAQLRSDELVAASDILIVRETDLPFLRLSA